MLTIRKYINAKSESDLVQKEAKVILAAQRQFQFHDTIQKKNGDFVSFFYVDLSKDSIETMDRIILEVDNLFKKTKKK